MTAIPIHFTDDESIRIAEKAKEAGMSSEELIRLTVQSVVFPQDEDDFESIKAYLIEKYGDVYRKLA